MLIPVIPNAAVEQCPKGICSNSWFSPQWSGGEIRSSLLNCRIPPGAKRRGERQPSAAAESRSDAGA